MGLAQPNTRLRMHVANNFDRSFMRIGYRSLLLSASKEAPVRNRSGLCMKSCSCAGVAILSLAPNDYFPGRRERETYCASAVSLPHTCYAQVRFSSEGEGDRFSFRATAAMMSPASRLGICVGGGRAHCGMIGSVRAHFQVS